MRNFNILIVALIIQYFNCVIIFGQSHHDSVILLNSKPIDFKKVYLNPQRIVSVDVMKNSVNGPVLIFTKDTVFTFYRLVDIVKKYANINGQSDSLLFRINGRMIEDTTSIKIDDTYYVYVETEKLSTIKYLANKFHNLVIVNIDLESEIRKPVIRIRGNEQILNKLKNK
jgi:hypothetical protein